MSMLQSLGDVSSAEVLAVDATKSAEQKKLLEIELEAVGIRLNTRMPDVVFKQKTAGGVTVRAGMSLSSLSDKLHC